MRLIFLDVDGVLNNYDWAADMLKKGIKVFKDDILYEPSLLLLKTLVEETDAKIVLSSAWRMIPSARKHLVDTLHEYDLSIYADTPYVGGIRGDDIQAWFKRNPGEYAYVILDDDADMLDSQKDHLVQTEFIYGFCHEDYEKAKEILKEAPVACGI